MTKEFDLAHADQDIDTKEANAASLKFISDVTPSMVRQVLTSNFEDIDTNKNNLLSRQELSSFKPKTGESLVFDYSKLYFDELTRAHNKNVFGDDQISKTDLTQYEIRRDSNYPAVQARYNKYADLFEEKFEIIDTDKDEKVSVKELEAAADNPQLDVGAKQMVRFFRDNYDTLTLTPEASHGHHAHDGGQQLLGRGGASFSKDWLDFNSLQSTSNTLHFFGTGAVLGGLGGALMMGANMAMRTGFFPGWRAIAIGAAVGGLIMGIDWAIRGDGASTRVADQRAQLWSSISDEFARESAMGYAPTMMTSTESQTSVPLAQSVILQRPVEKTPDSGTTDQPQSDLKYLPITPNQTFEAPQYMRVLRGS